MTADKADYIVVGAGSAGCLLANRLSADPKNRVLLIEAGGKDWNPLIRVPMVAGLLYYLPSLNWGYETEPEAGLNGRRIVWPRGKVLGGSTAINGMMYIRGQREDYDSWAQMGLTGWSFDDVLPHFRSFEQNVSHPDDDQYHGRSGELFTERSKTDHPLYDAWLQSALEAGHKTNTDFNGSNQEGVGRYDFNIEDGQRVSAASAFLNPVKSRPNLKIVTGAQVLRLTFDGRQCTGVECKVGRHRQTFNASGEVILSAGAINSPQILQVSGIGDGTLLSSLGIKPLVARKAVGENLQDHIGIYYQQACKEPVTLFGLMRPDRALWAGLKCLITGKGPASTVPLEAGGFLRTRPELDRPDVHVTFVPGLSLETTQKGQLQHGFLTNAYQLRPESRGTIRIQSPDATVKPLIQPNYFSAPQDIICITKALELIKNIVRQTPFDRYRGETLSVEADEADEDKVRNWIRDNANTIFHPVGTCRMGVDDAAVLDGKLRVRGVDNLRVVDASVMPTITSGNTSAPTMMIAEKAAQMILEA